MFSWVFGSFSGLFSSLFFSLGKPLFFQYFSFFLFLLSFFLIQKKTYILFISSFLWTLSSSSLSKEEAVGNKASFVKSSELFSSEGSTKKGFSRAESDFFLFPYSKKIKAWILLKVSQRKDLSGWFKSLFLGLRDGLDYKTHIVFSSLGLYHLLVLSGLHVGFLGFSLEIFFLFFLRLFYFFRLIGPSTFLFFKIFIKIMVCLLLVVYASLVSFNPPVQRALLAYLLFSAYSLLSLKFKSSYRFLCLLSCQLALFPVGFMSSSSLLSWGSCFILLCLACEKALLRAFILTQFLLMLLVGAVIGKISLLGLFLNPLLMPVFSFVYSSSLLILLDDFLPPFIVSLVVESHRVFLYFLARLAIFPQKYPWLYLDVFSYSVCFRALLLALLSFFLLYLLKNLDR